MQKKLKFRISSALKDIIGRDLITDDYVAIFELVKNSYDAGARKVKISFNDIYTDKAKIVIMDDGIGMNYSDLTDKWLFLAYSSKNYKQDNDSVDYRDKIFIDRPFAGSKGIGRFSCDRLGSSLYLETKKREENSKTQILVTNWEEFEGDSQKEFINIPVYLDNESQSKYGVVFGTVLEISDLRSKWTRDKILRIKDSLSKLINPQVGNGGDDFFINIDVPDEIENDKKESESRKVVNGDVRNYVFEALNLKTTKIISFVDKSGEYLFTKLIDGGTVIYEIKQENKFNLLSNIEITLYYLNRAAKIIFHKKMGMASRVYGNVFLYKNGFRVYPYGEPDSDPMGIDKRKSRKEKSRLGTGEITGRIEITEVGNVGFKETSSRGHGLQQNEYYFELKDLFFDVLERLEKYVVDVQQWGLSIEDEKNISINSRVIDLLAVITNTEDIVDFKVPDNFIYLLEAAQVNSAESVVSNLQKIANRINDKELTSVAYKAIGKVRVLQNARAEAEKNAYEAQKVAQEVTLNLKSQITENLFLKSINASDYTEVISLLHHIGIYAGTIDNNLRGISLRVQNKISMSNDELYDIIKKIGLEVKKISNIVTFATKAKFNLITEDSSLDLNNYIKEYIENIVPSVVDNVMSIRYTDLCKKSFITVVKPIEINIIIDNIISNARKAKSKNLFIRTFCLEDHYLVIEFEDDGVGIKNEYLDRVYNIGFTTTDGSGVGLFHVKTLADKMGAIISFENNSGSGVTFKIKIKKKYG